MYGVLPKSCCSVIELIGDNCAVTQSYVSGCKTAIYSFWSENIEIIHYAGLGIALIELVVFILACCLSNSIKNVGSILPYKDQTSQKVYTPLT